MATSISVVIPAYNAAAFIVDALDSIARQSRPPDEVLVINDGSHDQTHQVIADWIARCRPGYPVRLHDQSNRGLPATRNFGIRQASGEWIALLDADDVWEPDHLERLLEAVAPAPAALAAYGAGRLLVNGVVEPRLYDEFWDHPSRQFGRPIAGSSCLELDRSIFPRLVHGNFIKPSSLMLSRAATIEIGLFDEDLRTGEDREFLVRLIFKGNFVYNPAPITQYRWHDDNISAAKNTRRNMENNLRVLDKIIRNRALGLTAAQRQACRRERRAATHGYLYVSSLAGWHAYRGGLGVVRRLFGLGPMLRALHPKHLAHCLVG